MNTRALLSFRGSLNQGAFPFFFRLTLSPTREEYHGGWPQGLRGLLPAGALLFPANNKVNVFMYSSVLLSVILLLISLMIDTKVYMS